MGNTDLDKCLSTISKCLAKGNRENAGMLAPVPKTLTTGHSEKLELG